MGPGWGPGWGRDVGREPGARRMLSVKQPGTPKEQEPKMGTVRATQAFPEKLGYWAEDPGFLRSLPNLRLLSNYG